MRQLSSVRSGVHVRRIVRLGQKMTADDAMDVIRRDREFYDRSGGGVTLSGGEALLQPEFCREVLKRCREEGIHTCVESALHVSPVAIDRVAPFTQLLSLTSSKWTLTFISGLPAWATS